MKGECIASAICSFIASSWPRTIALRKWTLNSKFTHGMRLCAWDMFMHETCSGQSQDPKTFRYMYVLCN